MDNITTIILVVLTIATEKFLESIVEQPRNSGRASAIIMIVLGLLFLFLLSSNLISWMGITSSALWNELEQTRYLIPMFNGWYRPHLVLLLFFVQLCGIGLIIIPEAKRLKEIEQRLKTFFIFFLFISAGYDLFFWLLVTDPNMLVATTEGAMRRLSAEDFFQVIAFLSRFTLFGLFLFLIWVSLSAIALNNLLTKGSIKTSTTNRP